MTSDRLEIITGFGILVLSIYCKECNKFLNEMFLLAVNNFDYVFKKKVKCSVHSENN